LYLSISLFSQYHKHIVVFTGQFNSGNTGSNIKFGKCIKKLIKIRADMRYNEIEPSYGSYRTVYLKQARIRVASFIYLARLFIQLDMEHLLYFTFGCLFPFLRQLLFLIL